MSDSALIKSEQFMGIEIRIIETDPLRPVIPLVDIAHGIGYAPNKLAELYERNQELLKDDAQTTMMVTGEQVAAIPHICLTREGIIGIMMKLDYLRIKDKEKKLKIITFQKWAKAKLADTRIQSKPATPEISPIKTELQQAREYAEACGTSPEAFQAAVFRKHGMNEFAEALEAKPALVSGESGWFNPSQLAEMCRGDGPYLDAKMINHYLNNNPQDLQRRPFQYRDNNKLWRLTELGKEHGREYMFRAVGGHEEIRIEWRETILYASGLKKRNV